MVYCGTGSGVHDSGLMFGAGDRRLKLPSELSLVFESDINYIRGEDISDLVVDFGDSGDAKALTEGMHWSGNCGYNLSYSFVVGAGCLIGWS